jgi:hypothetical protein
MADPELAMYLPSKEQLSNKLPEKDFSLEYFAH